MSIIEFHEVARLPGPGDNAAVAIRTLAPGTVLRRDGVALRLGHAVWEGHRFAVAPIAAGAELLSWGLPFGLALRDIAAGEYLCNDLVLGALASRELPYALPERGNFRDHYQVFDLGTAVMDGAPTPGFADPGGFLGFAREGRGVGTRNHVAVIGLSAAAGPAARGIAADFAGATDGAGGFDGVVPVAHTEGGIAAPHNRELVLRTLAGFCVHGNVGAVLLLDAGDAVYTPAAVLGYAREHGYPIARVPLRVLSLEAGYEAARAAAREWLEATLPVLRAARRTRRPLADLRLALQCGGSDAFSGISGNPLAGWLARAIVGAGGGANLAETDELIGAESYILRHVRDRATAERFVAMIARYRELAGRHGHAPEGNPSGGNFLRGLYNIVIKSLGAAMKKAPDLRLDEVLDYGAPMAAGGGFAFMDSPGNDLESVAGQVASGCNVVCFVTGNGSITNFPFVPTVKVVTTSGRYALLPNEMDVNAGAYLDGTPMDALGAATLDLLRRVAGGERTAGERAGHSQVQIWRNWAQGPGEQAAADADAAPSGVPVAPAGSGRPATAAERPHLGLILPTSLCSGQIAALIAAKLTRDGVGAPGVSRWLTLPHTEGCGVSGGASEALYVRTLIGHAVHPDVAAALFLEHGCEKTHNGYLRQQVAKRGLDPERFGWASIQLDGGLATVTARVQAWAAGVRPRTAPGAPPVLGLLAAVPAVPTAGAEVLADWARERLAEGWSVLLAEGDPIWSTAPWQAVFGQAREPAPTLAYGASPVRQGLHVMAAPTRQISECQAGLGGSGARAIVLLTEREEPYHPMLPVVALSPRALTDAADLQARVAAALLGLVPAAGVAAPLTHFQITRGHTGFSL